MSHISLATIILFASAGVAESKAFSMSLTSRSTRDMDKRSTNQPSSTLHDEGTWWSVDLGFGTPAKTLKAYVDTGSGNIWSTVAQADPSLSSTFQNTSASAIGCFNTGCFTGYYGTDTLWLGGTPITNTTYSVATGVPEVLTPNLENAVLGLSWGDHPFAQAVKDSGLTQRAMYSMWMDASGSGDGTLVFGGVDQTKFIGRVGVAQNLDSPSYDDSGNAVYSTPTRWTSPLNGITVRNAENHVRQMAVSNLAQPIWFDSGTTNSWLPQPWLEAMGAAFGCSWDDDFDAEMCGYIPQGSVIFDFSGVEVEIDVQHLVTTVWSTNGDGRSGIGFMFTREPQELSTSHAIIFGNTWMRYVYMLFDMESQEIGFAKALTGETASMVEQFFIEPLVEVVNGFIPYTYTGKSYGNTYFTGYSTHSPNNPGTQTWSAPAKPTA